MRTTRKPKQIYIIFSVGTEHDIISYKTKSAGWSKGIPLLFEVFDASVISPSPTRALM